VVQLETSGLPILDAGGNLTGYRGADTDVTERRRAEKALAESQAQILALFNSTNDMIWSVDRRRSVSSRSTRASETTFSTGKDSRSRWA